MKRWRSICHGGYKWWHHGTPLKKFYHKISGWIGMVLTYSDLTASQSNNHNCLEPKKFFWNNFVKVLKTTFASDFIFFTWLEEALVLLLDLDRDLDLASYLLMVFLRKIYIYLFKKQQVFQLNILLSSTGSFISIEIHRLLMPQRYFKGPDRNCASPIKW